MQNPQQFNLGADIRTGGGGESQNSWSRSAPRLQQAGRIYIHERYGVVRDHQEVAADFMAERKIV